MTNENIAAAPAPDLTESEDFSEWGDDPDQRYNKLLGVIACAYQIAGAHDAPEHILDVLADPESATKAEIDAMLPYVPAAPDLTERAADLGVREALDKAAALAQQWGNARNNIDPAGARAFAKLAEAISALRF